MQKENIDFNEYIDKNVKIFVKKNPEPITGKVKDVKNKFLLLQQKKAIKQENKIVWAKRTVKLEDIEKII